MNRFFLIIALLFLLVTAMLLWVTQGKKEGAEPETAGISGEYGQAADMSPAPVGGAFTLNDQQGRVRTDLDFRGRTMLVFFGFTHCPDICPVTVATLSSLMELLGDKADQLAPIFITVDPERDTPEVMKNYLSNFDKRIVGLTGTKPQIRGVAEAYKVYYSRAIQKEPGEESHPAPAADASGHAAHGDAENYQMDHSGYIYLMDTQGNYIEHFRYDVSEQELADALKPYLK